VERKGLLNELNRPEYSLSEQLTRLHEISLELAQSPTEEELYRRAVERSLQLLAIDRLGIWLFDRDDPRWMTGMFGTDEQGRIRDEREMRLPVDHELFPDDFFQDRVPYLVFHDRDVFNQQHEIVGAADLVVAPIWTGTVVIGTISGDNLLSGRKIGDNTCQVLSLLARTIGHLAALKQTEARLRERESQLKELATTDGLTGILNRRTGIALLEQQLNYAERRSQPVSVCFIDLDGLKQINDGQGHKKGDEYITSAVAVFTRVVRESDVLFRHGGDEFVIVLPDTDAEEASRVVERLIEVAHSSPALAAVKHPPWFSCGLATYTGDEPERATADGLIHLADNQMYRDKLGHYRYL